MRAAGVSARAVLLIVPTPDVLRATLWTDKYQVMPRALLVCYLLATHVTLTPAVLLCEQM